MGIVFYFIFYIFPSGRRKKNIQPPTPILMQISAADTAARSGVGMMMGEKGAAVCYIY